jgi:hypothetical protein
VRLDAAPLHRLTNPSAQEFGRCFLERDNLVRSVDPGRGVAAACRALPTHEVMFAQGGLRSLLERKVILTCAVTGNARFNPKHPDFPVTPKQIAAAVAEAAAAGASVALIHVRNPETAEGSRDPVLFLEVVDRIRQAGTNIVINLTDGLGAMFHPDRDYEGRALPSSDLVGVDERVQHLKDCLPEMASLDITTGNQVEGPVEFVYLNTTRTLRGMATKFQEFGLMVVAVEPKAFLQEVGPVGVENSYLITDAGCVSLCRSGEAITVCP